MLVGKADKRPARSILELWIRRLLPDTLFGWTDLVHYFRANNKAALHCGARVVIEHFLYLKLNFTFPAEIHMVFTEINRV